MRDVHSWKSLGKLRLRTDFGSRKKSAPDKFGHNKSCTFKKTREDRNSKMTFSEGGGPTSEPYVRGPGAQDNKRREMGLNIDPQSPYEEL